jgi:methylglutaconyl-CoA hydratase
MTFQSNLGTIKSEIIDKIAFIEFYHPASNSFPSDLLQELVSEINQISSNDAVTVVVLQSQGNGAFCAGASFDELLAIDNIKTGTAFFSGFANVINAMRKCSKIIVGRVHGKAVGGGVGLAAACDYVFATQNAAIKLSELEIGIGPFVIEPVVSKKIGKTAMSVLSLSANQWKSANWALEKGLYCSVFESVDEMDIELRAFCSNLARYNPEALIELKKVFWENTNHWDELLIERAKISGKLVVSAFTKNALNKLKKV